MMKSFYTGITAILVLSTRSLGLEEEKNLKGLQEVGTLRGEGRGREEGRNVGEAAAEILGKWEVVSFSANKMD
ncbi:hypothetical protein Bpfe_009369 [Biomphalaria pfeifferi]|uniref:Uncharacterized protein n=1 Tax=Biomphalaria pfeifferi TaxID=112525 RepID=A0AAD8BW00_BIOPF|nr:hypothetical protein Bpfe_009369 [Biomphalaria pfeifferi]